jgi:serine/threonine protein kinase
MNEHVTLMHPDARDPTARAISSGFPVDLLSQSAGRLRVLALLYAFVFFMAGIFPSLLFPSERARFHAQTPPTPPSARTDQPIPQALDDLVLSCLAKDPAQRPQSARELSLRLAEVEGTSAWTQDRAREWWATHQLALQY